MLAEDDARVLAALCERDDLHAGALDAQRIRADAAEEIEDVERLHAFPCVFISSATIWALPCSMFVATTCIACSGVVAV